MQECGALVVSTSGGVREREGKVALVFERDAERGLVLKGASSPGEAPSSDEPFESREYTSGAGQRALEQVNETWQDVVRTLVEVCDEADEALRELSRDAGPDEVSLKMSVKVSAGGQLVLLSKAEGGIEMTATWRRRDRE